MRIARSVNVSSLVASDRGLRYVIGLIDPSFVVSPSRAPHRRDPRWLCV